MEVNGAVVPMKKKNKKKNKKNKKKKKKGKITLSSYVLQPQL